MMVPFIPPPEGWAFPGAPAFVRQGSYQFEFDAYTGPEPHTQPRAHTLPLISNPQARDRKTISCLFVVRWTDTHSHQHLACDYWESTN